MAQIDLVIIEPIEYRLRMGKYRNPRIIRYRSLGFSPNLTQAILNRIIEQTKLKKKTSALQNPDRYLFYEYGNQPIIVLDLLERTINTTTGTLKHWGMRKCQQQASILLRLLRKHHQAYFIQRSITCDPGDMGRTAEDREVTFQALHDLFNDKVDKHG